MITFDIDIDQCLRDTQNFFREQVPFAVSMALNNTAFDVRHHEVNVVYPASFAVRNQAFPKQLWRVGKKATKRDLVAEVQQNTIKGLLYDWPARHADGGTKIPHRQHSRVAIPVEPEKVRRSGGAVAKGMRPRNLKRRYIVSKGDKLLVFKRVGRGKKETSELMYVLAHSARIEQRFPFYSTASAKAIEVFSGHYSAGMDKAINTSRFVRG